MFARSLFSCFTLSSLTILLGTLLLPFPARANQAEALAHHYAMVDIAATAPAPSSWTEMQEDSGPSLAARTEEWNQWYHNGGKEQIEASYREEAAREARNAKGFWDYEEVTRGPTDRSISAYFLKSVGGVVQIQRPSQNEKWCLLIFRFAKLKAGKKVEVKKVTLSQTGEKPATVNAFVVRSDVWQVPGKLALADVIVAVPDYQALLDGMLDEHEFILHVQGREVFRQKWHGGLAARDELLKRFNPTQSKK